MSSSHIRIQRLCAYSNGRLLKLSLIGREAWQAAQSAYERVLSSLAEKKSFFDKRAFFEEGEKNWMNVGKNSELTPKVPSYRRNQILGCPPSQFT